MKKAKLLMPIIGLTATAGMIIPAAVSCGDSTFDVVVSDGFALTKTTAQSKKVFDTEIAWTDTNKVVDESTIDVLVNGQSIAPDLYIYRAGAVSSGKGHIWIKEGVIDGKVEIRLTLTINPEQVIYAQITNTNDEASTGTSDYVIPYVEPVHYTIGDDYVTDVKWASLYYYDETIYYSRTVDVKVNGVEIFEARDNVNPEGYLVENMSYSGFTLTIPKSNFVAGNSTVEISVYLVASSLEGGFHVNTAGTITLGGYTLPEIHSDTTNPVSLTSSDVYYEFVCDLNNFPANGLASDQPIYVFLTYRQNGSGEYNHFNFYNDSTSAGNRFSTPNYGYSETLFSYLTWLPQIYGQVGGLEIYPPAEGWGATPQAVTFNYHFNRSWKNCEFIAHVIQIPEEFR